MLAGVGEDGEDSEDPGKWEAWGMDCLQREKWEKITPGTVDTLSWPLNTHPCYLSQLERLISLEKEF